MFVCADKHGLVDIFLESLCLVFLILLVGVVSEKEEMRGYSPDRA